MYNFVQYLLIITLNLMLCLCLKQNNQNELPKSDWFMNKIFDEFSSRDDLISLTEIQYLIDDLSTVNQGRNSTKDIYRCYSAEELFKIFDFNESISKTNFTRISPSLLWLAIESQCKELKENEEINKNIVNSTTQVECKITAEQKFFYGSMTMIIIWITSILFVFITSRIERCKNYIILTLNALAVGTLLADAFLHIIPTTIGLDEHGVNNHEIINDTRHILEDSNNIAESMIAWKMFVILSTIFVLMFLSFFGGHGHSHGDDNHDHSHNSVTPVENSDHNDYEIPAQRYYKSSERIITSEATDYNRILSLNQAKKRKFTDLFGGTTLIIILANYIHKCADGLVIGAAFGQSLSLGFSTGLAILFHEIPHELGDYGMLSGYGFKYWQIMIISGIGSFTSLCALIIISAVKPNNNVRGWIFAVTAGLFIYIALVAMSPSMKSVFTQKKKNGRRDWLAIILVVIGFWIGSAFMLLIALFEEEIRVDATGLCHK